jgi:anti-anti-sigma regulatory factor
VTVQVTDMATGSVNCVQLADGKLVQLSGRLGQAQLSALRLALLTPLFAGCQDVVIDAGEVLAVEDEAVAVMVAADEWATSAGARLLLSRVTPVVEQALSDLGFSDRLQRLADLGTTDARPVLVSVPAASTD